MGILALIILGLIAGLIAKFVIPGDDPGGQIVTILVGIAGAFIGGFIFSAIGLGDVTGTNVKSIMIAAIGSFVLLFALRMLKRSKPALILVFQRIDDLLIPLRLVAAVHD